jgi:hypothetical protein
MVHEKPRITSSIGKFKQKYWRRIPQPGKIYTGLCTGEKFGTASKHLPN